MTKHTDEQRAFIVRKLAAFEPPRAIAIAFAAVFPDTKCNENDVMATDPNNVAVSPDLFEIYRKERERVLVDPASAPFADQAARLIALSNQAKFYGSNNQLAEQRTVFRQIAEETGVIGTKAGGAKADPKDKPRQITEIIETIVDPAAPQVSSA